MRTLPRRPGGQERNTVPNAGHGFGTWTHAAVLVVLPLLALLLLNANGREVGGYDSQPTKFAARALVRDHTLDLDRVVAFQPAYAERPGFARARDGHYRSAYPIVPAIIAAGPAWVLARVGRLDLDAPAAPAIIAKLTASLLVALAIVFAYAMARRRTSMGAAILVAVAFGFGTNIWLAGQTLGGHETVAFAMTGALVCLTGPGVAPAGWRAWVGAAMLALAGAARAQLAPAIAVLLLWLVVRGSGRRRWIPVAIVGLAAAIVTALNIAWFGHPLGDIPRLEALHSVVHATSGTFTMPWAGAAGLLVSPSRGLLVFSPIVLVCLAGLGPAFREGWRGPLAWCLAAATAEFFFYASYTVWWAGHSYGPRYCLDLVPLLIPLAAAGIPAMTRRAFTRRMALAALAWSIGVAAAGAFAYPAEQWNVDPNDVDRNHERLWDWRDPQFVRCWTHGLSPQNFDLFRLDARPVAPPSR